MKFDITASNTMRDVWLELYIVAGLLLEGKLTARQAPGVRRFAERSLTSARERLHAAGVAEAWIHATQLPVVGLLDEAARRSPAPGIAAEWRSLQFPLYGHEEAGRSVFEQLQQLRRAPETPVEVLEVYAHCLALGFDGEYAERPEALITLQESLALQLTRILDGAGVGSPDLTPRLATQEPPVVLEPKWVVAMGAILLMVLSVFLAVVLAIRGHRADRELSYLAHAPALQQAAAVEGGP